MDNRQGYIILEHVDHMVVCLFCGDDVNMRTDLRMAYHETTITCTQGASEVIVCPGSLMTLNEQHDLLY